LYGVLTELKPGTKLGPVTYLGVTPEPKDSISMISRKSQRWKFYKFNFKLNEFNVGKEAENDVNALLDKVSGIVAENVKMDYAESEDRDLLHRGRRFMKKGEEDYSVIFNAHFRRPGRFSSKARVNMDVGINDEYGMKLMLIGLEAMGLPIISEAEKFYQEMQKGK